MNKRQKKMLTLARLLYSQNSKNAEFSYTPQAYYKFVKRLYKNDSNESIDETIECLRFIKKGRAMI